MNNSTTQQQQLGSQGPAAAVYPTMVAPKAMSAESMAAAQQQGLQQMSYLMNSGLMANPLFQQMNGNFMLQQQQPVGVGNSSMIQQQQQQPPQQQQVNAAAPSTAGFDFSQLMNFNATAQPQQVPSSAFGSTMVNASGTMAALAKVSCIRDNAVSDDNSKRTGKTDRAKLNRDRNREHARSTRERKKAYVQKLRELVEKLHAERNEESRKRRVAVQHLAEIHRVRCDVVNTFLQYHSKCELDERRWSTIVEDDFWLKQPVTPYRSFHRAEIELECRISRGVQAMISDAASISVMLEMIGNLTPRWVQLKRQHFILYESLQRNSSKIGAPPENPRSAPICLTHQESRSRGVFSSLSSSDDLDSEENPPDIDNSSPRIIEGTLMGPTKSSTDEQDVTCQSREDQSISSSDRNMNQRDASKDFHDYNAMPLPDPKIRYHDKNSSDTCSSGDDSAHLQSPAMKRLKVEESAQRSGTATQLPSNIATKGGISHSVAPKVGVVKEAELLNKDISKVTTASAYTTSDKSALELQGIAKLPNNIAKKGGISHNIRPVGIVGNGEARLESAPATILPPFRGLGKKSSIITTMSTPKINDVKSLMGIQTLPSMKSSIAPLSVTSSDIDIESMRSHSTSDVKTASLTLADAEELSLSEDGDCDTIRSSYHINEDAQILMGDILMCPFVFRSHGAVACGALSECIMPGMLRAEFSTRNKLKNLEVTYDAMGFMQQLARACGNDSTAQIVPSSVEMALTSCGNEARVITLAKPPYRVMNVNEQWTRLTGYTQMDAEGKDFLSLLEGEHTLESAKNRIGMPPHYFDEVAKGRPACSTNIHRGKDGTDFIEFVSSFPLTADSDEVTHILHVCKELPSVIREADY